MTFLWLKKWWCQSAHELCQVQCFTVNSQPSNLLRLGGKVLLLSRSKHITVTERKYKISFVNNIKKPVYLAIHRWCIRSQCYSQEKLKSQLIHHIYQCWKILIMHLFLQCAFACASSNHLTVCRSSCIAYRQKVSHQCVKACDTSNLWGDWKWSCTSYKQWVFLQCVWACVV